jgi:hypothetical protein
VLQIGKGVSTQHSRYGQIPLPLQQWLARRPLLLSRLLGPQDTVLVFEQGFIRLSKQVGKMRMERITGVPYASTFFFPSFKVSGFISTITTPRAPSLAKETAIAFPSPRAPPVTKATPGARGPDLLVVDIDFKAN